MKLTLRWCRWTDHFLQIFCLSLILFIFLFQVLLYAKIYQDIQNRRKNSQHKKKQAAARLAQSSSKKVETTVTLENGNGIEMQVMKDQPRLSTVVTQTEADGATNGK